jgi:pyridoxal phosphate enzyme (YggS family)
LSPFADRLAGIRERIRLTDRDPAEVAVVAVSKGRPAGDCAAAWSAGVAALGENRVQEALGKLAAVPGAEWHLVGHLQTNKVPLVTGRFRLIHSLDSARLAELLAGRDRRQAVLLQVNVSREAAKQGVEPERAVALAREVARLLPLEGLMAIGPLAGDPEPGFGEVARLRLECREATGLPLPVLSMGMSSDFEAACRAGSTMLRLGRILFEDSVPQAELRSP